MGDKRWHGGWAAQSGGLTECRNHPVPLLNPAILLLQAAPDHFSLQHAAAVMNARHLIFLDVR